MRKVMLAKERVGQPEGASLVTSLRIHATAMRDLLTPKLFQTETVVIISVVLSKGECGKSFWSFTPLDEAVSVMIKTFHALLSFFQRC